MHNINSQNNVAACLQGIALLFPPDLVSVHSASSLLDADALFPSERRYVKNAVEKRINEFATGRHCARNALARFGLPPQAIERNTNGCPKWPNHFIGSISHTRGVVTAVIAKTSSVAAIGVDVETTDEPMRDTVWDFVCTDKEKRQRYCLTHRQRNVARYATFSAKESVIKSCYTLWGNSPVMRDICIDMDIENGCFVASFKKDGLTDRSAPLHWLGKVGACEGYVYTGVWIPKHNVSGALAGT